MAHPLPDIPLRSIARFTGIGYLVIFFTGFFSNFFVLEGMMVAGDAAATFKNIINQNTLFRSGIFSFFMMVIFDVLLAWTLFLLLAPVNKKLSILSAWLRLVNGTIFGVALYHLFSVLHFTGNTAYLNFMDQSQIQAQAMLSIQAFNDTWLVGLVFFGLHLFFLGYLIFKSGYMPKFIGVLLIIAAAGYLLDSFAHFLLTDYEAYKNFFLMIVVIPGVVGELSLTLWLLIRGSKIPELKS